MATSSNTRENKRGFEFFQILSNESTITSLGSGLVPPAVQKDGKAPEDKRLLPVPPPVEKVNHGGNLTDMAAFYKRTGHKKAVAFYRQLASRKDG